ncbi:hypothetical protein [Pseudoxanthomonas sp. PXM04]|uniref:hypothetical protein n=1 Tax=Pseudoxanthomonas sp. PXM04 TaxID=2769297 RepID=UPI00177BDB96|nr:hypothetical protein [Pseudoxanthomonas sp. PXM04]MBD9376947.1 hypothetical protein [Pseudoxanthomonas sp. PXM04]
MAATWITIAASSLPEIIRLARPLFTRTPPIDTTQVQRLAIIDEQIAELQAAATRNADSISRLATDMQKTIEVLQVGADRMEHQLHRANRLAAIATTVAALAFATALYALGR